MNLTFTDYQVQDGGIQLHFVCLNPGAAQPTDYFILITDADLSTLTTLVQFQTLIQIKLGRKIKAIGIASKLDPLIGQGVII